jgi:dATP pyrophosphohydrolase
MEIKSNLVEVHIAQIVNGNVKYLVLKRSDNQKYPNIWQMVTGKVRENEKAFEAAIREVKEETSIKVNKLWIVPHVNSFYNAEDNSVNLIPVFLSVIEPNLEVNISSEHQDYQWVKKSDAKNLFAWPGQAKSLEIINDYLKKKNKNLNFIEIMVD